MTSRKKKKKQPQGQPAHPTVNGPTKVHQRTETYTSVSKLLDDTFKSVAVIDRPDLELIPATRLPLIFEEVSKEDFVLGFSKVLSESFMENLARENPDALLHFKAMKTVLDTGIPQHAGGQEAGQSKKPKRRQRRKNKKSKDAVNDGPSFDVEAEALAAIGAAALNDEINTDEEVITTITTNTKSLSKRQKQRLRKKQLQASNELETIDSGPSELLSDDPPLHELLRPVIKDTFFEKTELDLQFPQIFGELCKDIITQQEIDHPQGPDGHIEFFDFVDAIEKQFRKEYQVLRLASFDHYHVKFHLEAATDCKVTILEDGFSEPKFFKVRCEWATTHLVPVRLFSKGGIKFVEVRIEGQWQRLGAFLDTLVRPNQMSYENMNKYWSEVQQKKNKAFSFMDLPLELRRNVYRWAMFYDGTSVRPLFWGGRRCGFRLPGLPHGSVDVPMNYNEPLLHTHTQIRKEAIEEYYLRAIFVFDHAMVFSQFIFSEHFGHVTRLELQLKLDHHAFGLFAMRQRDAEDVMFRSASMSKLRRLTLVIVPDSPVAEALTIDDENAEDESDDAEAEVRRAEIVREQLRRDYSALLAHLENCQLRII